MVRGKRPVRGGKRKFENPRERRPKPKKGKFNLKEASYVKERDAKNAEIENRRRRLEEEKEKQKQKQPESSSDEEEEENPMAALLASFSRTKSQKPTAIESESEEDSTDNDEEPSKLVSGNEESELEEINTDSENDSELEAQDLGSPNSSELEEIHSENDSELKEQDSDSVELPDESVTSDEEIIVERKEEEGEEDAETAREDEGHLRDPFAIHLNKDLNDELYKCVSSVPAIVETSQLTWPTLGKIVAQIPKASVVKNSGVECEIKRKAKLLEDKQFAEPGNLPAPIGEVDWNKLFVKAQIQNNIAVANKENLGEVLGKGSCPLTSLQKELFSIMNNYQDLLYTERTFDNASEIRLAYCLHAVNHALKTRTKVLHHNAKLAKSKRSDMAEIPEEYRDQGLVRPKILIIVPFRHSCLKIVETLVSILIGEEKGGSVVNKKRFLEDFAGNEIAMPRKNPKPEDYEKTFTGNTDDTFKIGLSVTKKTLKLYTDFYNSDIIISSVLGLRMLVGAEGEDDRDYDFLASVELLIMDQTDIFTMQNWDHLLHVLEHLHLQPKNSHDTDFSRVRSWCVNGWSKYYRQSLIFSSINLPELQAIFNKKCHNYRGKLRLANPCLKGSVCQVILQVPQMFHKFKATSSFQATLEARFQFFINNILPQYRDSIMNHTLIFVPSYFDFVKLRNYLKNEEFSFVQICEYSKDAKIARARDMFFHSDAHFLLYSERFHFFRRIRIKGIRHLIFYEPPTFPHFYDEMCNLMQEANQNPRAGSESNMSITTIYCKYDVLKIAAIVGTEKARKMLASDKDAHMLMTGD